MTPFDWVTARSECSIIRFFDLLRERVDSDVRKVSGLNKPGIVFRFDADIAPEKFMVSRERDLGGFKEQLSIVFERHEGKISARRRAAQINEILFDGIPTMNEEGECVFVIDKVPMRIWQVSPKALEELFFSH
jgi:hypothetical protein